MINTLRRVRLIYVFTDILIIAAVFYASYFMRYMSSIHEGESAHSFYYFREYVFLFVLWCVFVAVVFSRNGLYKTDRELSISGEALKVLVSNFYVAILMGSIVFFSQYKFISRAFFMNVVISLSVLLCVWRTIKRIIVRNLVANGLRNINVLILGAGRIGRIVLDEIRKTPWWGFRVVGFLDDEASGAINGIPVIGKLSDFAMVAKRDFVDEVIVAMQSEKRIVSRLIEEAKEMHFGVRVVPDNFEETLPVLNISYLGMVPLLTYRERRHYAAEVALKRILDFAVSLVMLIALSPVFVIISILIKMDSRGPVFFTQERVGYKNMRFKLYKFRSMVKGADGLKSSLLDKNEIKDGVIFKIRKDPRITTMGVFLRKHSLDELPQLINVLKGDMSLVGPRPPTPDEVQKYSYLHMHRLSVRPGLTCLSQIRGRSELTFRKWVKWDSWYIDNWSFGLDLRILWNTIPVVLKGKGAY